jgi:hypothetical protein
LRWGPGDNEVINWKIVLADGEHITEDPLDVPSSVDYVSANKDNELSDDTDLNDLFFEQFFPSFVGHAKIIDEFHADHRSPFHSTMTNDKIKFEDPDARTPRSLADNAGGKVPWPVGDYAGGKALGRRY